VSGSLTVLTVFTQVPNLLEAVRQLYDDEAGLPVNPFFFLAPRMAAFQEQHGLWALSDDEVLRSVEQRTSVEVVDNTLKLARVRQFPHAWGLSHVLALVDVEVIEAIHLVLRTLPGSFSSLQKLDADFDDCVVSRLTSLQAPAVLHSAALAPLRLPGRLQLRVDVQVEGDSLEAALNQFASLILDDIFALQDQLSVVRGCVVCVCVIVYERGRERVCV
jgi:hypothetical protein